MNTANKENYIYIYIYIISTYIYIIWLVVFLILLVAPVVMFDPAERTETSCVVTFFNQEPEQKAEQTELQAVSQRLFPNHQTQKGPCTPNPRVLNELKTATTDKIGLEKRSCILEGKKATARSSGHDSIEAKLPPFKAQGILKQFTNPRCKSQKPKPNA